MLSTKSHSIHQILVRTASSSGTKGLIPSEHHHTLPGNLLAQLKDGSAVVPWDSKNCIGKYSWLLTLIREEE